MIHRDEVLAIGFVMPVVDGVVVGLRFLSAHKKGRFGADNWLIAFGYAVFVGCSILALVGTFLHGIGGQAGNGTSQGGLMDDSEQLRMVKKFTVIFDALIDFALMGCKLSLLFFYRRLFIGRVFNIITWVTAFLVVAWAITMFFLQILQCGKNPGLVWHSAETVKQYCLPGAPISLWNASFDVAMDLVVIGIPLYYLQVVRLSRAKKILLTILFAFGGIAVVASVLRLVVYTQTFPQHNKAPDQVQYLSKVVFYSLLEAGLAFIAASLPTYGTLLSTQQKRRLEAALDNTFPTFHLNRTGAISGDNNEKSSSAERRSSQWSLVQENRDSNVSGDVSKQTTTTSSETDMPNGMMQQTNHSSSTHFVTTVSPQTPSKAVAPA